MDDRIGFDDIPFIVVGSQDGATYTDWVQEHDESAFRIPGSGTTVIQNMGYGLANWTALLEFSSMENYRALKVRQKTTGILTLYANYTSAMGTVWQENGIDYEDLSPVELVRLAPAKIEVGQEWIEAEATFRVAMDPLTGRIA